MQSRLATLSASDLQAHSQWVLRLARRLLRDAGAAEDVAQETWLAALRNPPRGELRPWLAQICRNFARQHLRSRSRRLDRERLAASEQPGLDPAELVERAEIGKILVERVLALVEPYRSTMLLRYQEGLSTKRIAQVQGVPAGTVRGRLSRAAERLREELDARHGGDRQGWSSGLAAFVGRHGAGKTGVGTASGLIKGVSTMVAMNKLAVVAGSAATVLLVVWGASRWGVPEPVMPADSRALADTALTSMAGVDRESPLGPAGVAASEREPVRLVRDSTRGRVVALESEVGIEGVEVRLVRESEPEKTFATDRTGADGAFSFAQRPESAGRVAAEPPPGWRVVPSRSSLELGGLGEQSIVLVLRKARSGRVLGRLVDEADERPLGDFALRLLTEDGWDDFTTEVDGTFQSRVEHEEGEYLLGLVDLGIGFSDVARIDHLPWGEPAGRVRDVLVRVGPTFLLDIELPDGLRATQFQASLRRGGRPEEDFDSWGLFEPVREGDPPWVRFSYDQVEDVTAAGPWHLLVGSLDGLWLGWAPVPQVRGLLRDPLHIELIGCGAVVGRVIDEQGRPCQSIPLKLVGHAADAGTLLEYEAQSGADGTYSIGYAKPGDYSLRVRGWSNVEATQIPLRIEAGVVLDSVDVRVRQRQGAGSVSGRVRSASGTYHGSTHIRILAETLCEARVEWEQVEDEWIGSFEITDVPEGDHRVWARIYSGHFQLALSRETVRAPCDDLELLVQDDVPAFDLQFRVLDAGTGSELPRFLFEIDFAQRYSSGRRGDESAKPALSNLPEGRAFQWSVRAPAYAPAYGTESDLPESGDVRVIEARLEPGWGARFLFFNEDGMAPLAGVRVLFDGRDVGVTGPDGVLEVTLPARPEKLELSGGDWALAPGWAVDPETGRFDDDESWSPIYVALRQ